MMQNYRLSCKINITQKNQNFQASRSENDFALRHKIVQVTVKL